jgi:hypothetical protein
MFLHVLPHELPIGHFLSSFSALTRQYSVSKRHMCITEPGKGSMSPLFAPVYSLVFADSQQ